MKKINFKQPKYILPLVVFLPLVFLGYTLTNLFGGGDDKAKSGVVTDNINMSLPDAANQEMGDKMTEMSKRFAESRKHINSYQGRGGSSSSYGSGSRGSSRQEEMDDYARELENIQNRSRARQRAFEESFGSSSKAEEEARRKEAERIKAEKEKKAKAEKPEIVKKVADAGAEKFNTIDQQKEVDEPLIKAMIDKTTKAHEGTRLRFKLLDDVMIKNVKLKKGTYLYGIVTGFGQQRVMATITSILVKEPSPASS